MVGIVLVAGRSRHRGRRRCIAACLVPCTLCPVRGLVGIPALVDVLVVGGPLPRYGSVSSQPWVVVVRRRLCGLRDAGGGLHEQRNPAPDEVARPDDRRSPSTYYS